jgi:hypothetical protein
MRRSQFSVLIPPTPVPYRHDESATRLPWSGKRPNQGNRGGRLKGGYECVGTECPPAMSMPNNRLLEGAAAQCRRGSELQVSRQVRSIWSRKGLIKKEMTVRGSVCMKTSTGMPGTSFSPFRSGSLDSSIATLMS